MMCISKAFGLPIRTYVWPRFLTLAIAVFWCSPPSYGNENILAHQHYLKIQGNLPEPHSTFEIEVELDEKSDDVRIFRILIDDTLRGLASDDIAKLKNVELATLQIHHNFYTAATEPDAPPSPDDILLLIISVELGESYRVEYEEYGDIGYHWGKDRAQIAFVIGGTPTLSILPLSPMFRYR